MRQSHAERQVASPSIEFASILRLGFRPFENDFGLQQEEISNYLNETKRLKAKYEDKIKLFTSMEFDYIPTMSEDIRERATKYQLDYIISSVHLVYSPKGLWFIDGSKQESSLS